jgi:tetratricopeptide (TPR) repeat protein
MHAASDVGAGRAVAPALTSDEPSQELLNLKWRNLYALVPCLLALLTAINTLSNGYASDDSHQVVGNAFIKSISNLSYAFTTSVWSFATDDVVFSVDPYYRPLFNVLFTINYALFGAAAWGWHLFNILIHAAVTLLVFAVIKEITENRSVALITASLFAVHPAHAESIAWISGITDPLTAVFLLPAFYFYLRYRRTNRNYLIGVTLGWYLLSLLSKETALALPLVILYCELFYFNEATPLKIKMARALMIAASFLVPTAIYFFLRYTALSRLLGSVPLHPLGSALTTIPLATTKYLALMIIPTGYSYQHLTPIVDSVLTMRFLGPLALVAFASGAVFFIGSQTLRLAAVWFIVMLAPALYAIRQFGAESVVQERYLYLPSIGFCLIVALGVEYLAIGRLAFARSRVIALSALMALIVLWGAVLIRQNRVWANDITLFENCVDVDPSSINARIALARAYYNSGKPRDAEAQIQAALSIKPDDAGAFIGLSYFAHREGKLEKSIEYLERAAASVEDGPTAHSSLGTIHLNIGLIKWQRKDISGAEGSLLRSIEIWPRPVGWYHTGNFYFEQGRYEDARVMYERSLQELPRWFAPVHLKLGQVYERLGQPGRAKDAYKLYLDLTPATIEARAEVMRRLEKL